MKKLTRMVGLAAICLIAACSKKNDYNSAGFSTTSSVFKSLAPQSKFVTLNATTGGSFYGNSGSRYTFPPNAFRRATGALVTGNVTLEVKECVKRSDMIFSGVLPISYGQPLVSGGESYVKATSGGEEVYIAEGKLYQVNIPKTNSSTTGFDVFLSDGNFDPKDTLGNANWQQVEDTASGAESFVMVLSDSISLNLDSVGWANADRFMTIPADVSFTITVNAGGAAIPDEAIKAFALFDNYNGVWPLGEIGSIRSNVITEQHTPATPCLFVVAAVINGDLWGGSLSATPATGSNYNITLQKMTTAQFKAIIDAH